MAVELKDHDSRRAVSIWPSSVKTEFILQEVREGRVSDRPREGSVAALQRPSGRGALATDPDVKADRTGRGRSSRLPSFADGVRIQRRGIGLIDSEPTFPPRPDAAHQRMALSPNLNAPDEGCILRGRADSAKVRGPARSRHAAGPLDYAGSDSFRERSCARQRDCEVPDAQRPRTGSWPRPSTCTSQGGRSFYQGPRPKYDSGYVRPGTYLGLLR